MTFVETDYPSLYHLADKYSIEGKNIYLRWIQCELGLLILAAVTSLFAIDKGEYGWVIAIISTSILAAGMALTMYIKYAKFENRWFIGRAIAESIKTLTWKYVTKGSPFVEQLTLQEAGAQFIQLLGKILAENKTFLGGAALPGDDIHLTEKMEQVRQASFEERKSTYIESRVKNQLNWYKKKSVDNKQISHKLFWIMIIAQGLALVFSLYLIKHPKFINLVPLFTTFAAAILSWLQITQSQQLAQSYAIAANDISLILAQAQYIETEAQLQQFVADAENAFSREHTLWTAKRDVFSY